MHTSNCILACLNAAFASINLAVFAEAKQPFSLGVAAFCFCAMILHLQLASWTK